MGPPATGQSPVHDREVLRGIPQALSPVIDGVLDEWNESLYRRIPLKNLPVSGDLDTGATQRPTQVVLERDGKWRGPDDLSGWVSLALDPCALYLLGHILDDRVVAPPSQNLGDWNEGDAIEIFLDTDPDDASPRATYSDDDYQIFLWPGHREGPPWGVMRRGAFVGGDAGFVGVEVVFRPLAKGSGYTFEARFPLVNLPHLGGRIRDGYRIGFNIALGDREPGDADRNKYVYMTWNGKGDLWQRPSHFGSLVVHDPARRLAPTRPATRGQNDHVYFVLGLAAALILFAFFFTWLVRWIAGWRLRRKLLITAACGVALIVVVVASAAIRRISDRLVEDRVADAARRVKEVVGSCQDLVKPDDLLDLVKGMHVGTRKDYRYTFLPVGRRGTVRLPPHAAEGATAGPPEYLGDWTGVEVRRGGRTAFLVLGEELGDSLSLVLSASRRPGIDPELFTPDPEQPIARIYLEGASQQRADRGLETLLFSGPTGDLFQKTATTERRPLVSFPLPAPPDPGGRRGFEVRTNTRGVLRSADRPCRLVILPEDDAHIVEVHGISSLAGSRWQGIPFRLESSAIHPLELVYGTTGPTVSAQRAWERPLAVDQRLDCLWVFFKCWRGYPEGSPLGTTVAQVVLVYDNDEIERIPLESGVHLESCRPRRDKHPPRMRTQVALNAVWDRDSGHPVRTRRDVLTVPLAAGRASALRSIEIQWQPGCSGPEEITVTAITGGTRIATDSAPTTRALPAGIDATDPGSIRLAAELRAALDGFRITSSVMPAVSSPQPRREGAEVVAYLPLTDLSGLRLALKLTPEGLIEGARKWAGVALLACLLPLVLVLAADGLGQTRRLRLKLFLAIGLVAMPPLALLVVYLDDEIRVQIDRKIALRAHSATNQVAAEIDRLTLRMETIAREVVRDRDLLVLLDQEAPTDFDSRLAARLAEIEKRWPESRNGALEILLWDRLLRKVHRGRAEPSAQGSGWIVPRADRSGLYGSHSAVLAIGHAPVRAPREPQRWSLCAVRSIAPAWIEGILENDPEVSAFAFHPGLGHPFAGFMAAEEDHRMAAVRAARILALRAASTPDAPVLERRRLGGVDCTVGARTLLDAMEEPVLVVGAAVNRLEAFKLRGTILRSALVVGAVMLLLFVVITFLVTRRVIDPLVGLSRAARRLAQGEDRMPPVPIQSHDEVGNLTAAFNDMAAQLRKRLAGLDLLNSGMRALNDRRTIDGIVQTVAEILQHNLHPATVFVALHEPGTDAFSVLGGRQESRPIEPRRIPAAGSFLLQAMNAGRPTCVRAIRWLTLGRGEDALLRLADEPPNPVVTLPLDYHGDPIGLIVLAFAPAAATSEAPRLDAEALLVLATMAGQIAGALENARLYRLAVEDPVTGLLTPGFFEGRLKDEIQRAARHRRSLALVKLRVEETPIVAARYRTAGLHLLLRAVANALRNVLRREGSFATRLETNEFLIALTEADRETGFEAAQQLAGTLAIHPLALGRSRRLPLTLRCGSVTFPEDGNSFEFLLRAAARALDAAEALRIDTGTASASALARPARAESFEETGMVLKSPRSLEIVRTIDRIAATNVTVLITGETGTGKELFAELIHRRSNRHSRPLIKVNCAALPELLLESELFGHERGAFTGAHKRTLGRFELADSGTLFLDEIGEISPSTQVKLLRVLQDKKIERIGGTESIELDVRIIAATNQDMLALVRKGSFREDLYYRLNVISLEIPPLRDRKEEIPALVDFFLRAHDQLRPGAVAGIRPAAMDKLHNYDWPGNIRELKNVLERAVVAVDVGSHLEPHHIVLEDARVRAAPPAASKPETPRDDPLDASVAQAPLRGGTPAQDVLDEGQVINPRQREFLQYLRRKKSVTNQEYVAMMNISTRTGIRDLNDLIQKRLIQRIGSRRAAVYRILDDTAKPEA
ncbi:MAG: sigma 54-interacting transcriptional regulator [Planctomycetes bacterium]|nr:sigma 54-interacting transcriptional regulator [Planctomycetota bacterium]